MWDELWTEQWVRNDPEGLLTDENTALWDDNDNPIQVDE